MNEPKEIISVLENLVETCRDGQEGYRNSAEHIKSPELRRFFNEQSLERGNFAGELEQEIQRLGKRDPERSGTVAGSLHRAWINVKSGMGAGDASILDAVESGEDTAKKNYEKAVQEKDLPENIASVVRRQYESIIAAHDFVRSARDRQKAA